MKNDLIAEIGDLRGQSLACLDKIDESKINGPNVYFLDSGNVLALPRIKGDSRYVYGDEGFNFWVHASGYMYANDGLFSLFMRRKEGDEPVIAFFVGLPKDSKGLQFKRFSLLPVPVIEEPEDLIVRRYTVMNNAAAYFFTECDSLFSVLRVNADEKRRIAFTIHLENQGKTPKLLYTSSFLNPFCRHHLYKSDEDRWFKRIQMENEVNSVGVFAPGILKVAEDKNRFTSMTNRAVLRGKYSLDTSATFHDRQTNTSRQNFMGDSRRNLASALALRHGKFHNEVHRTTFTDNAVFSDINTFSLKPGGMLRVDYLFEIVHSEEEIASAVATPISPKEVDKSATAIHIGNSNFLSSLEIEMTGITPSLGIDEHSFNQFLEHLKYQVSICGLLKGYMQLELRSLIGIRDVFQALEGLQYYRMEASRDKMLEALGFTLTDGRCPRQYSLPPAGAKAGRADLRQFIDSGLWIITAIHTYLQNSDDKEFLDTEIGYHKVVDEASESILPSEEKDSVLNHLFRIMEYLNRNRDDETKLVWARYGDWNDALDGLGIPEDKTKKFGTGVSVMASLQFYQNCTEMINILNTFFPNDYRDKVKLFEIIRNELAENLIKYAVYQDKNGNKRIYHGWGDKRNYFVGSLCDPDGVARDGITSYAYWIISGMIDKTPEMEKDILRAFERLQLDSKYGLKTFHPPFPKETPGVGRIPKLPPGTAENGATYIHATLFGIMAYFKIGYPKEAWKQISLILPFTDLHNNYTHSPFVMPNSYVFNPELGLDGESMNDWQTGSSNVLLKILLWYVFGYNPMFTGLKIQPAAWTPFQEFQLTTKIRGKAIKLLYSKSTDKLKRTFIINDLKPLPGTYDRQMKTICYTLPYEEMSDSNVIRIFDPAD